MGQRKRTVKKGTREFSIPIEPPPVSVDALANEIKAVIDWTEYHAQQTHRELVPYSYLTTCLEEYSRQDYVERKNQFLLKVIGTNAQECGTMFVAVNARIQELIERCDALEAEVRGYVVISASNLPGFQVPRISAPVSRWRRVKEWISNAFKHSK